MDGEAGVERCDEGSGRWMQELDSARVKTGSRGLGGEGNVCMEVGEEGVLTNIVVSNEVIA